MNWFKGLFVFYDGFRFLVIRWNLHAARLNLFFRTLLVAGLY